MAISHQFLSLPALELLIERNFIAVAPETKVVDAVIALCKPQSGPTPDLILVVSNKQLVGVLETANLLPLMLCEHNRGQISVGELIEEPVVTLTFTQDTDATNALLLLQQHQLKFLVVVNCQRQPLGYITTQKLCQNLELQPFSSPQSQLALNSMISAIRASLKREQVLETTANQLQLALAVSHCLVMLEEEQQLSVTLSQSMLSEAQLWLQMGETIYHQYQDLLVQGQAIIVPRIIKDYPIAGESVSQQNQLQSFLLIPLQHKQSYLGCICLFECSGERHWSTTEINVVKAVADHCVMAIRHAQLYSQAQTEIKEGQQALAELNRVKTHLQVVIDTVPGLVSWMDNQARYLGVNRYLAQALKTAPEEFIGKELGFKQTSPEFVSFIHQFIASDEESVSQVVESKINNLTHTYLVVAQKYDFNQALVAVGIDITGHQWAIAAMQESEERFRRLADTAPVLIWMSDAQQKYNFFNQTWLDFTGKTLTQEQGNGWQLGIHPEDFPSWYVNTTYAVQARETLQHEYRLQRADGEYRWLLETGVPRFTADSQFTGYIGCCLDITKRKKTEAALRDSEARYRLVVEDQRELICRFSADYRLIFVNQAYCRYFGQEREQLLGQSFLPLIAQSEQNQWLSCLSRLTQECPVAELDNRILTPQGEIRWQHWTHRAIFNLQGQLQEFQSIGQDITERILAQEALKKVNAALEARIDERTIALTQSNKYLRQEIAKRFFLTRQLVESEAKLRDTMMLQKAILDSASYLIIATSPSGMILTFNQAAEKLLGYSAAEVIGTTTPLIFHDPEQLQLRAKQLSQELGLPIVHEFTSLTAKAQQDAVEEQEWTYIRKDGSSFPVLLCISALRDHDRKITGFVIIGRDITASKQAQENLRLQERAIAASNNGIVITDATQPQMPIIYVNRAFEEITGYSTKEVLNHNCRILQGDCREQAGLQKLRQALKKRQSCTVVLRNYRKDGTPFWNELSVSPIYDYNGNLTHYIGIQNDITERKHAVEELEQAKAQLQVVLDTVPGMVSWIDSSRRYLGVNQHLARTYNLPPEAFVGKQVNFLGRSPEFSNYMRQFFASRAQKLTREIITRVGDEQRSYLVVAQKYQQGEAAVSVGIDITNRRQTEEELRTATSRLSALIENLQAGVIVQDELGRVVLINEVFCTLFKLPMVPAALIGADFNNFALEYKDNFAQPGQFIERYQRILNAKEIVTDEEIQLTDGRTVARDYIPIIVAGNYCGHLWMYSDITERKRSEAELRQALIKEKELGELKSRFVTNTSHEFRTPLTTILSSSELLEYYRHRWSEEKQLTHLHRIQKSVKQMIQLLNDILIIGRAEAGKMYCQPKAVNLEPFCQELAQELQLYSKNGHIVAFKYQGKRRSVALDEKLLRHIFTNLIANAIKYSPAGTTVSFDCNLQEQEAIFKVRDQGIGIPSEDQVYLFESFHRANNVGDIQGTGLGLSIVKKCVDVHGGEINVESEVGKGTTFTVLLPVN